MLIIMMRFFQYIIHIFSYLTLLIRESVRDLVPAAWEPPQLESGIQSTDASASKKQMHKERMLWHPGTDAYGSIADNLD